VDIDRQRNLNLATFTGNQTLTLLGNEWNEISIGVPNDQELIDYMDEEVYEENVSDFANISPNFKKVLLSLKEFNCTDKIPKKYCRFKAIS